MAREVTLVDAGIGNLASVERALIQVGAGVRITSDPDKVATSRMVVFPGQSAFGAVSKAIVDGAMGAALKMVIERGAPFLGICMGMQLLFDGSEESPEHSGLGIIGGMVRQIPGQVKRPQMQWNALHQVRSSPLLTGLDGAWLYFVHSYAADLDVSASSSVVTATCDYGGPVVASVQQDSIFATQFHPEKSSEAGRKLLTNFVDLCRGGTDGA